MGCHFQYRYARLAFLTIAALVAPSALAAQVVVRGILYDDSSGVRLSAAAVMLVDPQTDAPVVNTRTDSLGQFTLKTARGVYQIAAVREGYTSVLSAPIPLADGELLTVRIPIAARGDPRNKIGVLEHIRSASAASPPSPGASRLAALERRKVLGTGLQYGRADLDKSSATTVGQFLLAVPGASIRDPSRASSLQMRRGSSTLPSNAALACHVGWFIEGNRVDRPGANAMTEGLSDIRLDDVEAIEVFRGLSEMPPEFAAPDLRCGAIALWMRHG